MEVLTKGNLVAFMAFVLPGFLSMKVFGLLHPTDRIKLKDNVLEAISFSLVNFVIMIWPISNIVKAQEITFSVYAMIIAVFFIFPLILPVILHVILNLLAAKGKILQRSTTAWDEFFLRRAECWVIAHLKDGRRIGGWFGTNSYASLYPNQGHLYIEELWELDENGSFQRSIPASKGAILRPGDYDLVELFEKDASDGQ